MKEKLIALINKTESVAELDEISLMIENLFYYEIIGQREHEEIAVNLTNRRDEIQ